jgi:hypothetical protein
MPDFIYNNGSYAHRGVWHVVEGEIEWEDVEERTATYKSDYFNETSITHYPKVERAIAKAKVMCPAFNSYENNKQPLRVVLYDYDHGGGSRKPLAEHRTIERTAKIRYNPSLVFENPEWVPAPLCSRCAKKAGL